MFSRSEGYRMSNKSASSVRQVLDLYEITYVVIQRAAQMSYSPVVAVVRGTSMERVSGSSIQKIRQVIHDKLSEKGCPLTFDQLFLEDPAQLIRDRSKDIG